MSSVTGGLVMLNQMLPKLLVFEQKSASYIIDNPEETISLTAMELEKNIAQLVELRL